MNKFLRILVVFAGLALTCSTSVFAQKKLTNRDTREEREREREREKSHDRTVIKDKCTVDHGHEAVKGELNFKEMANYELKHPPALVRLKTQNEEDDDEELHPKHSAPNASMMHYKSAPMAYGPMSGPIPEMPVSATPSDTFESTIDNNTYIPPDTHGAVDSNYCVTTLNGSVHIQSRVGGEVSSVTLNTFWSPVLTGGGSFDPRVHYDPYTNRWIIVAVSGASTAASSVLIAISKTSNPTGAWWMYKVLAYSAADHWLDFPDVGFNNKWITITGNLFPNSSGSYAGAKVYAFNKANLLNGTGASYTGFVQASSFTIAPALTYDNSLANMFMVESWDGPSGTMKLWKLSGAVGSETMTAVGFPTSSNPWWYGSFTISGTYGADFAPQSGTTNKVQTNDDRVNQMVYMNGKLWFSHTIFLPYSSSANPTRSSIQWWQTDTAGTPVQIGRIDDATGANFYAFPSMAVNTSNDAMIGFAAMSSTSHPSAAYAVRMHTDATDSIRTPYIYRHGQNSYYKIYSGSKNRWGDYSATALDPLNQTDFWTLQEAVSSTVDHWDTWWAHVSMGGCAVFAITGTMTVCTGSSVTLADASTGGTWSSSSTGIATVNSSTGVVTGVAVGTTTITYTVGSCTVTATVTVNGAPSAISGSSSVCVGLTTTMTDASSGGTWSSTSTGVATVESLTGVVTGVSSGTSTIDYTTSCGTVTKVISVNANPAAITGAMAVCSGSTTTLSDATSGGTWTSSNTSVATVGASTGVVTGVLAGTAIISYAVSTGCQVTATITVNTTPAAITGTAGVCAGVTTTLADATSGGTWSSSNTAIATVDTSGIVTGVSGGTATISYNLSTGCRATITVTVSTLTAITGAASVCIGFTTTLGNSTSGGTWSSSTTTVATVGSVNGVVTGVAAGTSTITYTVSGGCRTTVVVSVNTLPMAMTGTTSVCEGATTTLSDATVGGNWSSSDNSLATVGTTGIVTGVSAGVVTISYTLSTGCFKTLAVTVNAAPSAIGGTLSVCAASTTTLTNSTSGGTWASSTTSVATVGSLTGIVSGVAAGVTTITYTAPGGCKATASVTTNALPAAITGTATVCAGANTTLSSMTTGGVWSSSDATIAIIGTSGIVTGVAAGTATITYTLGTGCFRTTGVTVNASPGAISGTAAVCIGLTTSLTNSVSGGTWTSSSAAVASVNASTGVVTGVAAGTATITYGISSGCKVYQAVTVNALPAAIGGTLKVCPALTTTLTNTTAGGTWSSANTATATIGTDGVVTGVSAGTVVISYAVATTGCYKTAVATVNPLPAAITGTFMACPASTTTLADATTGGVWSSGNTAVATISTTGVVSGVAAGAVMISYTLATGCYNTTAVTINSLPAAITGNTSVCAGSTNTLTDATGGGAWTSSNTAIATIGATDGIVTGVAAGNAAITYTVATGCRITATATVTAFAAIAGTFSACVGLTSTLTDATAGGTWSSSDVSTATVGSSNGVVTGVATGTVTITYMLASGCIRTATVSINALPSAITGTMSVCAGLTTTLSDGVSGGTWSSSATGVATIGSLTGIVTGIMAGTAIMTYTAGAGCRVTATVSVIALPAAIGGTTSVCVGSSVTLTDATTGGTWTCTDATASVGASSGIVTGIAAGTATVTYTVSSGCFRTVTVSVNPVPGTIGGTLSVCIGFATTLTNSVAGGTWSSSATGVATMGSVNGIVTGISAGTSNISYTASGCTATAAVTVNALPAVITGSANVCEGSATTLSSTTAGGTWSSNDITTASVDPSTGVVTGVAAGSTLIIYLIPNGCYRLVTETVNPLPASITGTMNVCVGSTTTLSSATAGGTFSSSNTSVATVGLGSGVVTGVAAGVVTVTYTMATGCFVTAGLSVNPLPAPITGTTSVYAGFTTTLSDATAGGVWSSNDITTATVGSTDGIVTGVAAGSTLIIYLLPTGCYVLTTVTVNSVATNITGTLALCQGSTSTLSDGVPGGTWTSADATIATIDASGVVSAVAPGTATITYSFPSSGMATAIVSVNPLPAPVSGVMELCAGMSGTLSDATSGGLWTSSTTSVATIGSADGIVSALASGTTIITYTLSTGCLATGTLTVDALPAAITGTTTVPVGMTITLSDATVGGGWTSNDMSIATVNSSGVVTGVATGNTTITYTLPTGCYVTVSIVVGAPVPPIAGTMSVCVGSTTTLSHATSGGTWSSSDVTIATISSSGVVTGVATGTATMTYLLPSSVYVTTVVSVNALPASISGGTSVCVGSTITFSDATSGGAWSSSSAMNGTIDAGGVLTGLLAGALNITYTLSTGCYASIAVTVSSGPTAITGTASMCVGATTMLNNGIGGGAWSSSDISIAIVGSMTGQVTGVSGGLATITYTISNGCYSTIQVTVNALPATIGGTTSTCIGTTATLTDATSGGTWTSSNTSVATIDTNSGVYSGMAAGMITITYTASGGCKTTTGITINASPASITGTTSVCVGSASNLSSTTMGGNWSSSDVTTATVSSTGVVTGVAAGNATITYSIGTGCYRTASVSVNALPDPISGTATVCIGATTTLSSSPSGGTWSGLSPSIANVSPTTGVVTGVATGTVTITYSIATGCKATIDVTVTAAPASITGTMKVCPTLTTTLSDVTAGGAWSSSDITLATVGSSTGVVTGVSAGTLLISYSTGVGCYKTTIFTVNAAPAAITGSPVACVGSTTSLADATGGGLSWTSSNTMVATVNSSTGLVSGVATGNANITYTLGTGCIAVINVSINGVPAAIGGTLKACPGTTTTLTNTVTGGAWSSSNTAVATVDGTTGVVTGVTAGTSIITYATGAGCTKTANVTINALPAAITGYMIACVGTVTTLTDAGGGTWSSSATGVATVGLSTGVVTGVSAATATITYTLSTGCYNSATVTVNATPPAITGTANVCAGSATTLADATSGGTWSSSNAAIATAGLSTGIITGVGAGTITISYNFGTGCRVTTSFTVKALPAVIGGASFVCVGAVTTLSDVTSGGLWTSSNVAAATVGTGASASYGAVTGVSAGTTDISYTIVATGCARTKTITVNTVPDAGTLSGPITVVIANTITLASTAAGGTWVSGTPGVATIGSATGIVTGVSAGATAITYTLNNGCGSATATYTVNVTTSRPGGNPVTTSGQANGLSVSLYPNPTNGLFSVKSNDSGILVLYSLEGKELQRFVISGELSDFRMPAGLSAGVYMCRFNGTNGGTAMIRLVYQQ